MTVPTELLEHLHHTLGLERRVANRVVEEVLAYFDEPPESYVARRHQELRAAGTRNPDIFERLKAELAERRFPAPTLTSRQIRRLIYG